MTPLREHNFPKIDIDMKDIYDMPEIKFKIINVRKFNTRKKRQHFYFTHNNIRKIIDDENEKFTKESKILN